MSLYITIVQIAWVSIFLFIKPIVSFAGNEKHRTKEEIDNLNKQIQNPAMMALISLILALLWPLGIVRLALILINKPE